MLNTKTQANMLEYPNGFREFSPLVSGSLSPQWFLDGFLGLLHRFSRNLFYAVRVFNVHSQDFHQFVSKLSLIPMSLHLKDPSLFFLVLRKIIPTVITTWWVEKSPIDR
jgi:hypothetical protein